MARDDLDARLGAAALVCCHSMTAPDLVGRVLTLLLGDETALVRGAASRAFRQFLCGLKGASQLRVLLEWTGSENPVQRVAIAAALGETGPLLGRVSAVAALAHDARFEVRYAAAKTVTMLLASNPSRYGAMLADLSRDDCKYVRLIACAGLASGFPAP
jgi:hypothetical protein